LRWALIWLLVPALALPFSASTEERLFGLGLFPLENPAALGDEPEELYLSGDLSYGSRLSLFFRGFYWGEGVAYGLGLGYPLRGYFYQGAALGPFGVAAGLELPTGLVHLALAYRDTWALYQSDGDWRLFHRFKAGRGRGLFELSEDLTAFYYGEHHARGVEKLWLWGGVGLGWEGLGLSLNAHWQSPVFGGPLVAEIYARSGLGLSEEGLSVSPLSLAAGWFWRVEGGELYLRLPYLRLELKDGPKLYLAAGVAARITIGAR